MNKVLKGIGISLAAAMGTAVFAQALILAFAVRSFKSLEFTDEVEE